MICSDFRRILNKYTSSDIEFNIDKESYNYGKSLNSQVGLMLQRRSYEFGLFYRPDQGAGGIMFNLNGFNFNGSGQPFMNNKISESPILFTSNTSVLEGPLPPKGSLITVLEDVVTSGLHIWQMKSSISIIFEALWNRVPIPIRAAKRLVRMPKNP